MTESKNGNGNEKKSKLILENARTSIWLLIISSSILGGMDKITIDLLPYLLGFLGCLAVSGESAVEFIAQRFLQLNGRNHKLVIDQTQEIEDLKAQVRLLLTTPPVTSLPSEIQNLDIK